ncbi:MAG: AMP-binding protein [Planctomycetota bacterium]
MNRQVPYRDSTIIDCLAAYAEIIPNRKALEFHQAGEHHCLTYQELWRKSQAVARWLIDSNRFAGALEDRADDVGERVVLAFSPGIEFVPTLFGCWLAGVTPVPCTDLRSDSKRDRLRSIVRSCQPRVALVDENGCDGDEGSCEGVPIIRLSDRMPDDASKADLDLIKDQPPPISAAVLQYTSGSTSEPKGVIVRHQNLMANLRAIQHQFGLLPIEKESHSEREGVRSVSWLPFYHDMGLVGGLLAPLYLGGTAIIMSPESFLRHPVGWLKLISQERATVSGAPNFAYQLCVDRISPGVADGLDLSSWEVAFCGAEPIHARTLHDFAARFSSYGFDRKSVYPCYGMAESTLLVSGFDLTNEKPRDLKTQRVCRESLSSGKVNAVEVKTSEQRDRSLDVVSCGVAAEGIDIRIINPLTGQTEPPGKVGEICIRGSSVCDGYFVLEGEIDQSSHLDIEANSNGTFIRTGDTGYLFEDELYVTGRSKEMIIVRGRNLVPMDLERTAFETVQSELPATKSLHVAAFSVCRPRSEELGIAIELSRRETKLDHSVLVRRVRSKMIEFHQVDPTHVSVFCGERFPRTSSVKLQRLELRERIEANRASPIFRYDRRGVSTQTPLALNLCSVDGFEGKAEYLSRWLSQWIESRAGVSSKEIAPEHDFNHYGLDSMTAMELAGEIEDWTGVEVTPMTAMEYSSIDKLSEYVAGRMDEVAG